ncbi:CARDB domain-containing protein [Rufibacter sediminis]|uniref:T9SS type A sorting domain-containing protein n=1 Tax=Rufibacter sediminis TaxID=2762756 RepID=A0ABR6VZC0_9BACT|nr:CARDB domain-containing protein [Rufibacter sediminis]MBC3542413.1 T9SS type A sorting domain-containing protein [Rufibacter sediminis]
MLKNLLSVSSGFRWRPLFAFLLFFSGIQVAYSQADYAIQGAAASPTSVAAGGSVYATGSIYNLGNTAGASSNIGFYLSTNNTLDDADTFIGSSSGGSLASKGSSSRSVTLTVPGGTTTGTYYLLFVADYLKTVTESNENNNVSSVSIAVVPSSVDFTITSAYLYYTSLPAGGSLTVEGYISNQGNIAASSSNVGYYLSTNSTLDAADTFIGSSSGSAIYAGDYTSFYTSLTLPANTAPGTYYLIFAADYLNSVTESNETNNTASRQITVTAPSVDLVINSVYLNKSTVSPGGSISYEFYVYNQGNTVAASSNVGFYLSTNNTLDAADTFIGSSSGQSLTGSNSNYRYSSVTIPAGTAAGSYYLLFVADYLKTVSETNETNNVSSVAISVVAPYIDLNVQSPYLSPTSVTAGNSVSGSFYLYNLGNTTATSSNVGIYLSTNTTLESSDVFIGSSTGNALTGDNYVTHYPSVTIPSNTAAGTYYVLFVADYLGTITESNENNNIANVAISVVTPSIDLEVQSANLTATSVSAGNPVTATATIYNLGNTMAASSNIGYYLSTNSTLDATDVLVGFANGGAISAGYYDYRSASITIPANTTPGNYYLIQAVDYLNSLKESNENNNTGSTYLSVTAQGTTFITPSSGNSSFTTCTGKVYDTGGTGAYTTAANGTITLNPGTPGTKLQLSFTSFSLYSYYDYLEIYDGTTTSAPLIGKYTYTSPGIVTASSTSGALTLRFYSSGYSYYGYTGFEADIACVTPSVDLMLLSAFTSTSSLTPGTSFTTTSFIANTGATSSYSSSVGYYLSANSTFESTDLYLGNTIGSTLTSGNSAQRSGTISLPSTVTAGNYNLLFVADPTNDISETDETNNVKAAAVTVTSSNTLELAVSTRTLAATSVVLGGTVSATATLTNSGNATAPKSAVGFYLSTNTSLDDNDVLLTSKQTSGTLAAKASEEITATLTIPNNTVAGSYYILYVPDPENHIAESDETNGVMSLALTVTNNSIDLVVQNPALSPTSLLAGATVTATSTLRNQGSVSAASSNIGYYLSANNTFEASDVALTTTTGGALAGSTSAAKSVTLTIPTGTAAGNYYVLFVADPANAVTEGLETNNVSSVALTVLPQTIDLEMQTPSLSVASVTVGGSVKATSTIRNTGTVASSASVVGYYLSTNTTFESSDVALGTSTGGALAANASAAKSADLTIPAATAVGNYYILFVADPAKAVTESNETNNVMSVALTVTAPPSPDLVVETFYITPSTSFIKGTAYTVASIIKNQGNATSSASSVGFYLSTDATWDAADVLMAEATGSSLNQNATTTLTKAVTVPTTTATGSYYLIVKADHKDAVTESNETNNTKYSVITVINPTVDFTIHNVTASTGILSVGHPITFSARIYNSGNSTASSSNIGFYLSTNDTFDTNDIALGTITGGELASGTNATRSGTFTVPAGTPNGNYFLLGVADPANAVIETNEANNVVDYIGLSVYPASVDLVIQSTMISSPVAVKGTSINVSTSIMNSRTLAASSSNVGYYLSTNNTYETSDVLLGTSTGGTLASGVTAIKNATLTIPANTAAGNYFILFIVDPGNEVTENDETNNLEALALTVYETNTSVQKPDLVVQAPTSNKSSVVPGGTVTVTSNIVNVGNATAAAGKVTYYLSSNTTFESTDIVLGESNLASLAAGASNDQTTSLTIPANTAFANYFLLVRVDAIGAIDEIAENNNLNSIALTVKDPNGIQELSPEHKLTLWPNPATKNLSIEAKGFKNGEKAAEITVYSIAGQKVITKKATIVNQDLKATLDVTNLNHGLYLVYIQVGDTLTIRRVAVEK